MSSTQRQYLYELWHKGGFRKGKKPNDSNKLRARFFMLEAKSKHDSKSGLSPDKKPASSNQKNAALDRKSLGIMQAERQPSLLNK